MRISCVHFSTFSSYIILLLLSRASLSRRLSTSRPFSLTLCSFSSTAALNFWFSDCLSDSLFSRLYILICSLSRSLTFYWMSLLNRLFSLRRVYMSSSLSRVFRVRSWSYANSSYSSATLSCLSSSWDAWSLYSLLFSCSLKK